MDELLEFELLDEFDELFELELLDELELLFELEFELEFREEFDELLEFLFELHPPRRSSSRSRPDRAWEALLARLIFERKRETGSSATAGSGAAAPITRNALAIAINFFMVFLLYNRSLAGCRGGTVPNDAYSLKNKIFSYIYIGFLRQREITAVAFRDGGN